MKKYNLLLPIAGKAQRFLDAGYTMPKPLILANHKHVIDWSLESVDYSECDLIFIVRLDHIYNFSIDKILKQKFGDTLIVLSGGAQYGADKFVRKFALEFGIKYQEYNPAHTTKNLYSAMSDNYYNKTYHVSQFHHRNMLLAKACNVMMAFIPNGAKANGSESAIKTAKKLNKPVTIIT